MATFKNKPAYGTYTVNTGHAKCPNHAYLLDEGAGVNGGNPQDCVGTLDLTNSGGDWSSVDLGGGGYAASSNVLGFVSATNDYAYSANSLTPPTSNMLIVSLFYSGNSTGNQTQVAIGKNSTTTDYALTRCAVTTGYQSTKYRDASISEVTKGQSSGGVVDSAWHMICGRFRMSAGTMYVAYKIDNGGWSTENSAATSNPFSGFNRVVLSRSPGSASGNEMNGNLAAAFLYFDTADPVNDWSAAWVDELYADPWQFLNTETAVSDLKLKVAPSSNPTSKIYMTWET